MKRLELLHSQLQKQTLTISNSDRSIQIPIQNNYIKAQQINKLHPQHILRTYDPGYMNTITCTSKISFIDGDKGILEYRGYPIQELAEKSTFLEVAFLLIFGELPTISQYNIFKRKVMTHTNVHMDVGVMMKNFRYDAHPMGMICSTLAAISTFYPEQNPALAGQNVYKNIKLRNKQIYRLLGIIPTLAANSYRHRIGRQYNFPHSSLDYVENFMYMLDKLSQTKYKPNAKLVKALDVLFILHAQHELNCSTAAVRQIFINRHLASSAVDVYTAIGGASGALYGPKHGGANEAVLRMLQKIGKKERIGQFIEDVKNKKQLLFGFGHRVYKNYDPRAKIVKKLAYQVFQVTGIEPLVQIALQLQKIALQDKYFIERKLYPNVDFYSGIIYKAMGFPTDMFVILFTIPRVSGWLAHWNEFLDDGQNKIVRPRQNYQGYGRREYVQIQKRKQQEHNLQCSQTDTAKRNEISVSKL